MVTLKAHILPHHDLQPPGCRGSYMTLAFIRLTQVNTDDIIAFNNHPDVLRHMPLGRPDFNRESPTLT